MFSILERCPSAMEPTCSTEHVLQTKSKPPCSAQLMLFMSAVWYLKDNRRGRRQHDLTTTVKEQPQ